MIRKILVAILFLFVSTMLIETDFLFIFWGISLVLIAMSKLRKKDIADSSIHYPRSQKDYDAKATAFAKDKRETK